MHIALNYKNNPILGIVVLPSLDETWFGVENLGTWKESQNTKLGSSKFQSFSKNKLLPNLPMLLNFFLNVQHLK